MNYELFKEVIGRRIKDYLPLMYENCEVRVEIINKVNQIKDGLILYDATRDEGTPIPIVYLDDLYLQFTECEDLDQILYTCAAVITEHTGRLGRGALDMDPDRIMKSVVPNVINIEKNKELLSEVPSLRVIDMAVIYRVISAYSSEGFESTVVTNDLLELLEISIDELNEIAFSNMRSLLPFKDSRIRNGAGEEHGNFPRYIVIASNELGFYGSSYMLVDEVMDDIARDLNSEEVYMIPLSVNEFCVVPANEGHIEILLDLLYHCNRTEGCGESYLSNCIYCYSTRRKSIGRVAGYRESKIKAH